MSDVLWKHGYPLFSPVHLLVMAFCLLLYVVLCRNFLKADKHVRMILLRVSACIPIVLECIQDIVLTIQGSMSAQYLPFHLCGQAIFVEVIHSFMHEGKAKNIIGEMIFSMFLPGALMALVFPGWNSLPLFDLISIKKYAAHFCLVLYGIYIYLDKQVHLNWKKIWIEFVYLYGVALLLWPFNNLFDTNYLYTHEPVDPLRFIWDGYGKPAYTGIMILAGVFLITMMYLINDVICKVEKRNENTVCH